MNIVYLIAAVGVVIAIALLAVGRLGELPAASHDRAPLDLPAGELDAADVEQVRFALGLRGYRMDEVDVVLDRVSDDLAERDLRIAQLEATLQSAGMTVPAPRAQVQARTEQPQIFDFDEVDFDQVDVDQVDVDQVDVDQVDVDQVDVERSDVKRGDV